MADEIEELLGIKTDVVPRHSIKPEYLHFVEKDIAAAKEYFTKKVAYVTKQMEKVQMVGSEKNKVREAVMDVMEVKLQSQFAQQKAD